MNKNITVLFLAFAIKCLGQPNQIAFSENFIDNTNKWKIDNKHLTTFSNGWHNINTISTDDIFISLSKNLIGKALPNLLFYDLVFSLKINKLDENSGVGIVLNDVYDSESNITRNGFSFYIEKVESKFYLSCKNLDEDTPMEFYEIPSFQYGKSYEVKININNEYPKTTVNINNQMAFSLDAPIFNINNICLFNFGITESAFDYLKLNQSVNQLNKNFCFDVIDRFYNSNTESSNIYRGRYDFPKLTKHVPQILLCDNLFFPDESNVDIKQFIDELIKDPNCFISKSDYSDPKSPNLKFYKIVYNKNTIIVAYSISTLKLSYANIIFADLQSANEFFDNYTSLKKFSKKREENGVSFRMNPNFLLSFVSKQDNMVNFFFCN
ncbi:MAG: hypothetical protein RJA76_436 [Bacteroidota bacterium]|jgi:hypothetical protein